MNLVVSLNLSGRKYPDVRHGGGSVFYQGVCCRYDSICKRSVADPVFFGETKGQKLHICNQLWRICNTPDLLYDGELEYVVTRFPVLFTARGFSHYGIKVKSLSDEATLAGW